MSRNGGWTIEIREHSLSIDVYLLLNIAICDSTAAKKIDTKGLAAAMIRQMDNSYQITYFKDVIETININSGLDGYNARNYNKVVTKTVKVHCTVKYRIIGNTYQRYNNELLVDIQDNNRLKNVYGKVNFIGGSELYLREKFVANIINGRDNNTIPHELGHTLGLHHVDDFGTKLSSPREGWSNAEREANRSNIMFSNSSGGELNNKTSTTVIPLQINLILERYKSGSLNLR